MATTDTRVICHEHCARFVSSQVTSVNPTPTSPPLIFQVVQNSSKASNLLRAVHMCDFPVDLVGPIDVGPVGEIDDAAGRGAVEEHSSDLIGHLMCNNEYDWSTGTYM